MVKITVYVISCFLFTVLSYAKPFQNTSCYVDPYIGSDNGGNVFVGPCVPFGMVKLGPDIREFHEGEGYHHSNSGYSVAGDLLYGFSHVHVSGTGGGGKYGNILMAPFTGDFNTKDYGSSRSDEVAQVGYYAVTSSKYKVRSELTATHSVGFHQYTFPASDKSGIFIDAGHFIVQGVSYGEAQQLVGSEIRIISPTEIEGYSRVRWGWNAGAAYTVYFHAVFDTPAVSFSTWKKDIIHTGSSEEFDSGEKTGALFYYKTTDKQAVKVKVGISFVSSAKAKNNIQKELASWDFQQARQATVDTWNGYLSRINVESKDENLKKLFYTGIYHSLLMPTNRTGENPLWKSDAPYYDDFYAIWDTYRTLHPLLTLVWEKRQVDIVNSLVDIYKFDKYMPDARSGNDNGRTQGSSNCDILIADAFVKGLTGIDYETAFKAMIKNAEVSPGDNERKEGRIGIRDYNTIGYVSTNHERSASCTIEHGNCDWAIAQVAQGLGKITDFEKYKNRAGNWQNLWNAEKSHKGFNGFIWPKSFDGKWATDLEVTTFGSWEGYYYESNPWEYSLSVPQDVKKLIEKCGGKDKFIARLDTTFKSINENVWGSGLYNVSNEPGFMSPMLYIWAGQPYKTASLVRRIIELNYNTGKGGIPGNDDSGAMSSWLAFQLMGIYPNAGQNVYLITSPHFSKTTIKMDNNQLFEITAKNQSAKNIYIQSALLNGKPLEQAWFKHTDIKEGGKLELVMGTKPSKWGTSNPPPSISE